MQEDTMVIGGEVATIVQLNFTLLGLSGRETVRIDLSDSADARLAMLVERPAFELGMPYGNSAFAITDLMLQPHRLLFTVTGAPAQLPLVLRVAAAGPFLFGGLLVGELVETIVATPAERMRIIGPGYWAVPVPPRPPAAGSGIAPPRPSPTPPRRAAALGSAARPATSVSRVGERPSSAP